MIDPSYINWKLGVGGAVTGAVTRDEILTTCAPGKKQLVVAFEFPDGAETPVAQAFSQIPQTLERIVSAVKVADPQAALPLLRAVPELVMLTGKVMATPEGLASQGAKSISERIFGAKHLEFDRTVVGIMVLNWLLEGDYDQFVACQPEHGKLTRESFSELRDYTFRILQDADDTQALLAYIVVSNTGKVRSDAWDAMLTYMAINDLTKVKEVIDEVKAKWKIEHIDHDKALYAALSAHPEISPSFSRLDPKFQGLILEGLSAEFNLGQFMQAECPAASLTKIGTVSARALNFYLLHAVCDIAGAAGHVKENGSLVMTEQTYRNLRAGVNALEGFLSGVSAKDVYENYLRQRAGELKIDLNTPESVALTRIACLLRYNSPEQATLLQAAFCRLDPATSAILSKELRKTGLDDGYAILPYYSPALLANLQAALKEEADGAQAALVLGMTALARLLQEGRTELAGREGSGVYTLYLSDAASMAKNGRAGCAQAFEISAVGQDGQVKCAPFPEIKLPQLKFSLSDLPLLKGVKNFVIVAAGGGSDCVQAVALARLLESTGRECRGVISTGKYSVENASEIAPNVFRITSASSGVDRTGRFLETIASENYPTILVNDFRSPGLSDRLKAALSSFGDVGAVIALDTGGDALYRADSVKQSGATPDHDLLVLQALDGCHAKIISSIIACGVDSPANAQSILEAANAVYFEPDAEQTEKILRWYEEWQLDGSSDTRFGKTPYAWQAALRGEFGVQALPLPLKVVLDEKNPWNPYVYIQACMRGIFFMELREQLITGAL